MARRYMIMFDSLKEQQQGEVRSTEAMSELLQGIASFTKSVQQTLNSYEVRKLGDKVQGYVMNFTETEQKVREATNEDPWGPTGPQMQEIASFTFQYELYTEVMGMLWKRMFQENKLAWRRVYKSLVLLNYLIKNGSERVIRTARDHVFEMRSLENYKCVDERGKDEGMNVRHRVKLILELLNDEELLRIERKKAKTEGREKYQGFSKEDMLSGRGMSNSKLDSFEKWNEKTADADKPAESGGHSRGFGTNRREVTAFDFDAENRSYANGSPELGIRERSPERAEENEEDEFGDFTSARVGTAPQLPSVGPTPKPISSPPSARAAAVSSPQQKSSVVSNSADAFDLLGLGPDFGNNTLSNFASAHPSIVSNQKTAKSVNTTSNDDALLTDIFACLPDNNQKNGNEKGTGNGLVDLFTVTPANQPPSQLVGQPFDNDSFLGLDNHEMQVEQHDSQPQNNQKSVEQPKTIAVGSTWENLKGKVNIDFDHLCLNSPSKPTPSLNELKMTSTKGSKAAASSSTSAGNLLL
ncbi:hypothetical protein niasHT_027963 [Heterodera trifolii]|uniref:ENTH domain-containing protein n=1 Tax=Heterodera trifolii TaxID=157864 RepID=A0ABD2I4S4_9BILA